MNSLFLSFHTCRLSLTYSSTEFLDRCSAIFFPPSLYTAFPLTDDLLILFYSIRSSFN